MRLIGYLINTITAMIIFIFDSKVAYSGYKKGYMGEISIAFFIFLIVSSIWNLVPYILMSIIIAKHSKANPEWVSGDALTSLIVCLFGLYILADIFFIRPDPQSPVALFFLPPLQVFVFLGITAIFRARNSK